MAFTALCVQGAGRGLLVPLVGVWGQVEVPPHPGVSQAPSIGVCVSASVPEALGVYHPQLPPLNSHVGSIPCAVCLLREFSRTKFLCAFYLWI